MSEPNPAACSVASGRRSLFFLGSGALAGLFLAGYALFTARGTSTLTVPADDVALVNQQPIARTDYLAQLQTLYDVDLHHATNTQRRKVLEEMIREELFVQRAKELDVASTDPDVRSAMVNAVEAEMAADAISAQPSEAVLEQYFAAHRRRYASEGIMSVQDLVFPSDGSSLAARAAAELATRPPTAALLEEWHVRASTRVVDEQFYFAAKIHLGNELFGVAEALSDASASAPIVQSTGIHVLYMVRNIRPAAIGFAAARDRVLRDYRNEAIGRVRNADEAFLRKRATILISDELR